ARGAGKRRPPPRRDTDRLPRRQRSAPANRGRGTLQRLEGTDPLEDLAGRTDIALVHEVAATELDGIEAEPLCDDIVVLLDGPAGRRARRRADGARWLRTRVGDVGRDRDVRDAVRRAGQHPGQPAEV